MATKKQIEAYFSQYAPGAQAASMQTGIPASVILAQSAHESGYGLSTLAQKGFNLFGVKAGSSWTGKTISLYDEMEASWSDYRVYEDTFGSLKDWADNVISQDRYAAAKTNDPYASIDAIAAGGYASDDTYAAKVKDMVKDRNLTAYDKPDDLEWYDWLNPKKHLDALGKALYQVTHPFADGSIADMYKDKADEGSKFAGAVSPAFEKVEDTAETVKDVAEAVSKNWLPVVVRTAIFLVLGIVLLIIVLQVVPVKSPASIVKGAVSG